MSELGRSFQVNDTVIVRNKKHGSYGRVAQITVMEEGGTIPIKVEFPNGRFSWVAPDELEHYPPLAGGVPGREQIDRILQGQATLAERVAALEHEKDAMRSEIAELKRRTGRNELGLGPEWAKPQSWPNSPEIVKAQKAEFLRTIEAIVAVKEQDIRAEYSITCVPGDDQSENHCHEVCHCLMGLIAQFPDGDGAKAMAERFVDSEVAHRMGSKQA